jgi:hypothetical protein
VGRAIEQAEERVEQQDEGKGIDEGGPSDLRFMV